MRVRDLQGGNFGEGTDTVAGWVERARGWCWADDMEDEDNYLECMLKGLGTDFTEQDIMDETSEVWQLEFAKCIEVEQVGGAVEIPIKSKSLDLNGKV